MPLLNFHSFSYARTCLSLATLPNIRLSRSSPFRPQFLLPPSMHHSSPIIVIPPLFFNDVGTFPRMLKGLRVERGPFLYLLPLSLFLSPFYRIFTLVFLPCILSLYVNPPLSLQFIPHPYTNTTSFTCFFPCPLLSIYSRIFPFTSSTIVHPYQPSIFHSFPFILVLAYLWCLHFLLPTTLLHPTTLYHHLYSTLRSCQSSTLPHVALPIYFLPLLLCLPHPPSPISFHSQQHLSFFFYAQLSTLTSLPL